MQEIGFEGAFYVPKGFKFKRTNTKTPTKIKIYDKEYKITLKYYNYFEEEKMFEGALYVKVSDKVFDKLDKNDFLDFKAPDVIEINNFKVDFDCIYVLK